MNAKEFEVFRTICPHYQVDYYPSLPPEPIWYWYCSHSNCSTVERRCSRVYCPLFKDIKETDKD